MQEIPLNFKSERPTQRVVVQSKPLKQPLKVPVPTRYRISGEADTFYASLACEMAVPFRYIIELAEMNRVSDQFWQIESAQKNPNRALGAIHW